MKTTTVGVFTSHANAEAAIRDLELSGINADEISYIYRHGDTVVTDEHTSVGEGAATGAKTGALIGAIAGLVVANGILPGLGTLFVAGPLATALGLSGAVATTVAGAATGAAAGGVIGALANFGINKEDAELYEGYIKSGEIVVITRSDAAGISEVLTSHGAHEIRRYTNA